MCGRKLHLVRPYGILSFKDMPAEGAKAAIRRSLEASATRLVSPLFLIVVIIRVTVGAPA